MGLARGMQHLAAGDVAGCLQPAEPVLHDLPADLPVVGLRVDGLDQVRGADRGVAARQVGQHRHGLAGQGGVGRAWRRGSGARDPGFGAGRPVFDKPRIAGSVRASKHGANMGTNRAQKNDLER
jgi:hypothetical protein